MFSAFRHYLVEDHHPRLSHQSRNCVIKHPTIIQSNFQNFTTESRLTSWELSAKVFKQRNMGSTFYCSSRFHPYASEIKSRLPSIQTNTERRKPETQQSHNQNQNNDQVKSNTDSSQISKIGKYLIFARNVWNSSLHRAVDVETRKEYACRIIAMNKYREFVAPYFQIEEHDNVNKIVEVVLGDSQAYVIFEPSHSDLHSYVRSKRRLKEAECCKLFKQIVETVEHCHENGVILRDLKLRKFVFKNKER